MMLPHKSLFIASLPFSFSSKRERRILRSGFLLRHIIWRTAVTDGEEHQLLVLAYRQILGGKIGDAAGRLSRTASKGELQ